MTILNVLCDPSELELQAAELHPGLEIPENLRYRDYCRVCHELAEIHRGLTCWKCCAVAQNGITKGGRR